MKNLFEGWIDEDMKHKKRASKKTPKKSDHKHEYKVFGVNDDIFFSIHGSKVVFTKVEKRCIICGKDDSGLQGISIEEYEKFKNIQDK